MRMLSLKLKSKTMSFVEEPPRDKSRRVTPSPMLANLSPQEEKNE